MRITYRSLNVKDYWTSRWANIVADSAMTNENAYPLKHALQTVTSPDGTILEAGCGAGRILRYFHERGYDIIGVDYIHVAVDKLREVDSTLKVITGDITRLQFPDAHFRFVLAFGLYHNLEQGLDVAVAETFRVIEPGGRVCASFRADNIQTRITDGLVRWRSRKSGESAVTAFHKMNLTRREFTSLFEGAGFIVELVSPVENMPILYKFALFRAQNHKIFDENRARAEGYRLSKLGQLIQNALMRYLPDQFCNLFVLIARRP